MVCKKDDGENKEDGDVVCRRVREVVRRLDRGLSHRLSVRPSLVLEAGCLAEYHYLLLSPSGDLGIGLVGDNHPDRTTHILV